MLLDSVDFAGFFESGVELLAGINILTNIYIYISIHARHLTCTFTRTIIFCYFRSAERARFFSHCNKRTKEPLSLPGSHSRLDFHAERERERD